MVEAEVKAGAAEGGGEAIGSSSADSSGQAAGALTPDEARQQLGSCVKVDCVRAALAVRGAGKTRNKLFMILTHGKHTNQPPHAVHSTRAGRSSLMHASGLVIVTFAFYLSSSRCFQANPPLCQHLQMQRHSVLLTTCPIHKK